MSINVINNKIWFVGNTTDTNIHYIIQELEKLESVKNVSLFLNTEGGSVSEGLLLYDYLQYRAKVNPVNIVGISTVFSAGTYALFTDNPTYLYPHCAILMHPMSTSVENKETNNFIALTERVKLLTEQAVNIYAQKGFTDLTWQSKSVFYTAEEIIALGIAKLWSNPTTIIGEN